MKRLQSGSSGASRFGQASLWVEERFGQWPTWGKIALGAPILIVLTALVMIAVSLLGHLIGFAVYARH